MKLSRLFGLALGVALAASLLAAATASAADPEFRGTFPILFLALSFIFILDSSTNRIECLHDHVHGEILGASKVGKVVVAFVGCTGEEGGTTCTAKSKGAKTGEIITKTLDGELGLVAKAEAASGVGLLLLPEATKVFVEPEGPCLTTAPVEGSIAGEASPIGVSSKTGKVVYTGSKGSQSIKKITVLGSSVEPKLSAFFGLVAASETTTESVEYVTAVEVT
jgi:hypothetical protein